MGFAGVGVAAILLISTVYTGAALIDTAHDAEDALAQARAAWSTKQATILATDMAITSVSATGGTVTITAINDGHRTLDALGIRVLLDNGPVPIDDVLVNGRASAAWAAGMTLSIEVTAPSPSTVVLATQDGSVTSWRI